MNVCVCVGRLHLVRAWRPNSAPAGLASLVPPPPPPPPAGPAVDQTTPVATQMLSLWGAARACAATWLEANLPDLQVCSYIDAKEFRGGLLSGGSASLRLARDT